MEEAEIKKKAAGSQSTECVFQPEESTAVSLSLLATTTHRSECLLGCIRQAFTLSLYFNCTGNFGSKEVGIESGVITGQINWMGETLRHTHTRPDLNLHTDADTKTYNTLSHTCWKGDEHSCDFLLFGTGDPSPEICGRPKGERGDGGRSSWVSALITGNILEEICEHIFFSFLLLFSNKQTYAHPACMSVLMLAFAKFQTIRRLGLR